MYKISAISFDIKWNSGDKLTDLQRTYNFLCRRFVDLVRQAAHERMAIQKISIEHDNMEEIYRLHAYGDLVQMPADKE